MSNEWNEIVRVCNEYKNKNYTFKNSELPEDKLLDAYSSTLSKFISSIEDFKKYEEYFFCLCGIQAHLYKFYASDNKQLSNIEDINIFQNYFRSTGNPLCEFVLEKHWKYFPDQDFFRKEGENAKNEKGKYILKKEPLVVKEFNEAEFNNIQKNYSLEDKFSNYFWVYGSKHQSFDISSRFYINFIPSKELIKSFISELKCTFDKAQLPFSLKFLAIPEEYDKRCDVCVLYVSRNHTLAAIMALSTLYYNFENINDFLSPKKPLFTAGMVPGISFGEDPDDQRFDSFGAYRCCYLTLAFFELWYENKILDVESLQNIINTFEDLVDENPPLEKTHLKWTDVFHINKYSVYDYTNELKYLANSWVYLINKGKITSNSIFLKAAIRIGFKLTSNAFWYLPPKNSRNKRLECNWVDYVSKTIDDKVLNSINYKILNNEFIEGRLGVAFFINRLHYATKENFREFDTTHYRSVLRYIDSLRDYSPEINWFLSTTQFRHRESKEKIKHSPKFKITRNITSKFIENLNEIINEKDLIYSKIDKSFLDKFENKLIKFLDEDKPFSLLDDENEFQPSFNLGLSYIGYACLRIYGAYNRLNTFPPIHIALLEL